MSYNRPRIITVAGRGPLAMRAARMGGIPSMGEDGVPELIVAQPSMLRSSYRARSFNRPVFKRYSSNRTSRLRGPYRAMTYGQKHTHPVYPRPELKFVDLGINFTLTNGPAFVGSLCYNAVSQGLTGSSRIGQSISVKSFAYNINIDLPTGATAPVNVRIIVFWDKQANGVAPSATAVLTAANINAFMNMANKLRFTVLRNHYISLSPNGTQTVYIDEFVKINMQSQYDDTNTFPRTGAIFMLYGTDSTAAVNDPALNIQGRCRFYDN